MIATLLFAVAAASLQMTRISDIEAYPARYEGKSVRVCGWASNGRERQFIADRKNDGRHSVAIDWSPREPKYLARKRCVTGVVTAMCARPQPSRPGFQDLCIGPDWTIKQIEEAVR